MSAQRGNWNLIMSLWGKAKGGAPRDLDGAEVELEVAPPESSRIYVK